MCTIMDETQLNQRLVDIETKLSQLIFTIESNHNTNTKGIAEKVNDLVVVVEELNRWKEQINAKIITSASLVALFVGIIMWLADKIIQVFYE